MFTTNADMVKKGEGGQPNVVIFFKVFSSPSKLQELFLFYLNGFLRATVGDNDDGIVAMN